MNDTRAAKIEICVNMTYWKSAGHGRSGHNRSADPAPTVTTKNVLFYRCTNVF